MKVRLGDVCTIVSGSTPKTNVSEYWDGEIKWITPAELSNDSFYIFDSSRHISEEGMKKTGLKLFPTGTVILSSRAPIGKTAISGCEMCCNQGFKNLICSDRIFNEYLYFYLKSKTEFLNSLGRGATFKEISKGIVEEIEIPLPTYDEQKRIANELKKVSELIYLRKLQLIKLEELIKSQFIEMFGDPLTNSKGWETHQFSEYIQFLTSGSRGWSKYFSNNGEMFITIKNVKNCQISTDNMQYINAPKNAEAIRTKVQEGDLLISVTADLGRTGVVTKSVANFGAYINQHLTIVRLDKNVLNPFYAAWFMESPAGKCQFESKNQNAVKAGLNFNSINTLKILVPPIALQNQFVSFVEQVDKSKIAIQKSLETLESLKNSLMQQYFG